jgi:predicted lipoprotein with Yx(FWY)xxD motif
MKKTMAAAVLVAVLGAAGCANMGGSTSMPAKNEGGVLVGPNNMTLYTFDRDPAGEGKSVCVDKCAVNWPPFAAASGANAQGDWQVVTRPDGAGQWAYKGKPLYYWIKDQKPGDRTGDNVNNVWHVAKP